MVRFAPTVRTGTAGKEQLRSKKRKKSVIKPTQVEGDFFVVAVVVLRLCSCCATVINECD